LALSFKRVAAAAAAGFIVASVPSTAGVPGAFAREPGPLKMEEVEVRGYKVKPGRLFLPDPGAGFSPSSIRFDLFREDIARPIPHGEVPDLGSTKGGSIDNER